VGRCFIALLAVALTSGMLRAHSIWVIPAKGDSATVVVSDSPQPDGERLLKKVMSTATILLRQADGRVETLKGALEKDVYRIACPGKGPRRLAAVRNRFSNVNKNLLLTEIGIAYLADPEGKIRSSEKVPAWDALGLNILPRPDKGPEMFQVLYRGKPVEKEEVSLYRPGDSDTDKVPVFTTDKEGLITVKVPKPGRYGLLVGYTVDEKGVHEGQPFTQRSYECSLVIEVPRPADK
jgi:hypothetical protein